MLHVKEKIRQCLGIFRVWHGWVCVHRYEIAKSDLPEVVRQGKRLQTVYGIPLSNVIADEDGVGGGVVDFYPCKGFINNASPYDGENYENLKTQCSVKMAKQIQSRQAGEVSDNVDAKDLTAEEMGQIKLKDIDKDGKIKIIPKDVIKQIIGRSPDDWDSIMMRYWFALNPNKGKYFIN